MKTFVLCTIAPALSVSAMIWAVAARPTTTIKPEIATPTPAPVTFNAQPHATDDIAAADPDEQFLRENLLPTATAIDDAKPAAAADDALFASVAVGSSATDVSSKGKASGPNGKTPFVAPRLATKLKVAPLPPAHGLAILANDPRYTQPFNFNSFAYISAGTVGSPAGDKPAPAAPLALGIHITHNYYTGAAQTSALTPVDPPGDGRLDPVVPLPPVSGDPPAAVPLPAPVQAAIPLLALLVAPRFLRRTETPA